MKSLWLIAGLAASMGAQAHAACLAPDDARTLFTIALPDAIDGLTKKCAASLSPDAFLPNRGAALADRYRHEAPVDPARARHAIEVATGQDLSFLASDDTVTNLAHTVVEQAIDKKVAPHDCGTIDTLVALAAPMHADDMAEVVMLALQVAGPDVQLGKVAICRHGSEVAGR